MHSCMRTMGNNPRCEIDTNVLISALLSAGGTSNRAVYAVLRHGQLLSSHQPIEELEDSLTRPKFDPYIRAGDRDDYLALIRGSALFVDIGATLAVCRDPDDDKFLEVAISGEADVIVSGDRDLQVLHPFRGIPILSPDAFLNSDFVA